jgi:hypothetical protein
METPESLARKVDSGFTVFLRAYALHLYVRPMMGNAGLIARYGTPERQAGFNELRNALYWTVILELTKICDDRDQRTPSIFNFRDAFRDSRLLEQLEALYAPLRLPQLPGESTEKWRLLAEQESAQRRLEFNRRLQETLAACDELLASPVLAGYKTIRNKLIAHNELIPTAAGTYSFFEIQELKLKYGDERRLIELAQKAFDGLNSVVRRASFSWDSFFNPEERDVKGFWDIDELT